MRRAIVTALAAAALAAGGSAAWAEPADRSADSATREGTSQSPTPGMEPTRSAPGQPGEPGMGAPSGEARSGKDAPGSRAVGERSRHGGDAASSQGAREYTVQKGDTLAELAQRFMGSAEGWRELAKENGIDDPKKLRVGQRLTIPEEGRQGS